MTALVCLLAATTANAAVLTNVFELNGSYADDMGGPALVPSGGVLGPTSFNFGSSATNGQTLEGLSLDNGLVDNADYSIEIAFRWNDTLGWGRILDFKELSGDAGVYTDTANKLLFWNQLGGPGPGDMLDGQDFHFVLTRDGTSNVVNAYLDGVLQFSFVDNGNDAVFTGSNDRILFFQDQHASDERSGTVDRIRIYHGALTANEVGALANPVAVPAMSSTTAAIMVILFVVALGVATFRRKVARTTV